MFAGNSAKFQIFRGDARQRLRCSPIFRGDARQLGVLAKTLGRTAIAFNKKN